MFQFLIDPVLHIFYRIMDTFQPQSKYCVLEYSKSYVYEPPVFKELQDLFRKSFGDDATSKESPVETLHSYSIEFKNFYMNCYELSNNYFTNEEIYKYYIKGKSGLIFTIEFSKNISIEIEELKNRLDLIFSLTHKQPKVPILFIIYGQDLCNNSDVQPVIKLLNEFIQRESYEEYSCMVETDQFKDGTLYEGLEWLMSISNQK